jgi:nucleotide-binding universal stress UspA family protein
MFSAIVVGTDGSPTATTAVDRAIALAAQVGARLLLVSAYAPVSQMLLREGGFSLPTDTQWMVSDREDVLAMLEQARAAAIEAGVKSVDTFARQGDAADAIIDVAEEQSCDLIIVGNRGMTGAKRFLLGSVPNKISHHAPCSVLIVRTS